MVGKGLGMKRVKKHEGTGREKLIGKSKGRRPI